MAAAESVAALQALLDAAALALGKARRARRHPRTSLQRPEELRSLIAPDDSRLGASLLSALFDALDAEIARWEVQSREDPNARSVLRAFLGVREILWEISSRGQEPTDSSKEGEPQASRARRSRGTGALPPQYPGAAVPVEG